MTTFRWRFSFGLLSFLVVVTILSIWMGKHANDLRSRLRLIATIESSNGIVTYGTTSGISNWLVRLAGFSPLPPVLKVQIYQASRCDELLESMKRLRDIQEIWIREADLTDNGLRHLADFKALKSLTLSGTDITDQGFEHIGNTTSIETLFIGKNPLMELSDPKVIQPIKRLKRLRCLMLPENTDAKIKSTVTSLRPGILVPYKSIGMPTRPNL